VSRVVKTCQVCLIMYLYLETNYSVKGTALDRAVELVERLSAEGLSFVKPMKQSHVVRGFWLVNINLLGI
jgi:hypothetical protein